MNSLERSTPIEANPNINKDSQKESQRIDPLEQKINMCIAMINDEYKQKH